MTTRTITLSAEHWQRISETLEDCHDEGPKGEGWQSAELSAAAAALDAALAQPELVGATDDAELRTVYAMGAEARWREGFPEAWSLTDMERAAHTAGLRAVLARCGNVVGTLPADLP